MTTENKTKLHSATGTVKFAALTKARPESQESDKLVYSMRLEVEPGQAGAQEVRDTLDTVNDKLIITKVKNMKLAPGHFIFNAKSINKPAVYDKDMNKLSDDLIPMIAGGTARVIFSTFEGKSGKGGGINLVGVQLLDIEEYTGTSAIDESDVLAQLRSSQD